MRENKDEQNHLQRREIDKRKRREKKKMRLQNPQLCIGFPEGVSHQSEPSDPSNMGRREVLIEEEADEDTGETVWKKWKEAFSWNDFFYAIIFGLFPTSWDVLREGFR